VYHSVYCARGVLTSGNSTEKYLQERKKHAHCSKANKYTTYIGLTGQRGEGERRDVKRPDQRSKN